GGVAGGSTAQSKVEAKYDGVLEIDDLKFVSKKIDGESKMVIIGRSAEMRLVDKNTRITLTTAHIPYGAIIYHLDGAEVKKGDVICEWDPWNAVILSEFDGKVSFEN